MNGFDFEKWFNRALVTMACWMLALRGLIDGLETANQSLFWGLFWVGCSAAWVWIGAKVAVKGVR